MRMEHVRPSYTEQRERELKAAKGTPSRDDRIRHLERAVRFAQLAIEARKGETPVSLMTWRANRVPKGLPHAER